MCSKTNELRNGKERLLPPLDGARQRNNGTEEFHTTRQVQKGGNGY